MKSRTTLAQRQASIELAIQAAGGLTSLAHRLDTTPQRIANWRARGRVPAGMVLSLESATGISRHEIRPDVFGEPPRV